MVEHRETEGLSLCVSPKVSLESKGIDGWDECLDGVEGRARDGGILGHMTPRVVAWRKDGKVEVRCMMLLSNATISFREYNKIKFW